MKYPTSPLLRRRAWITTAVLLGSLTALTSLGGCGGGAPIELTLTHVPVDQLGLADAGTRVFRTRAEWDAFWAAHPHAGYPDRQTPVVDFGTYAVAAVFAGRKGRCNRLDITGGTLLGRSVTLRHKTTTFGQGTPSSCIGNDPFTLNLADMVLVSADVTEVRFEAE
ncbi:MAG: hypothetical protein U1F56_05685 [Rubrivivax sp.]